MSKQSNRHLPEYIDELPNDVFEITQYITTGGIVKFDRYWWDNKNNRLIMKPKRENKYKVVKPMFDKHHDSRFVHMFDINGRQTFINYDWLSFTHSIGYFLNYMI